MCKAFSYRFECQWETRGRSCKHVHSEEVRNCYEEWSKCMKENKKFTNKMKRQLLDPNNELDEDDYEAYVTLFEKYPKEPRGQELQRW